MRRVAFAALALWVSLARADEQTPRPSEGDIFGAPEKKPEEQPQPQPPREVAAENPLAIGGQFYLRSIASMRDGQAPSRWGLSLPTLTDGYFDARPNSRVRGYLRARMSWDPTVDPNAPKNAFGIAPNGGPTIALDQLWIRFDVVRRAYVTAGRQHVKWAAARFWNPTDYLHPAKRDPLAVFDVRTGTTMLRADFPTEHGFNFSAVALFEGLDYASTVGQVAGAARAEFVLGDSEIGLDAIAVRGRSPRAGGDVSFGLWDFDLYGELGLRDASEVTLLRKAAGFPPFTAFKPSGIALQATGGLTYTVRYSERTNNTVTIGAEYFYNDKLGYDDSSLYPWIVAASPPGSPIHVDGLQFTPFYLGKHYAGLFVLVPQPGDWLNTSFTLSGIGNLSDGSYIARVDYSHTLLTNLTLEAFGDVHLGSKTGELRLGVDMPATPISPAFFLAPPLFDAGVALRVSI